MKVCPSCGEENSDRARFCQSCGTALGAVATPIRETRRTVTIVFSDVSGSTSLAQRLDPESFRDVMARYFGEMRSVLERHGGFVEKFIGDAVMAVFGLPTLHEDDALRAVRAAVEMRAVLDRLNDEFQERWGVSMSLKTGLNTGEVVAGGSSAAGALVTGDAVNLAARLESAAGAGEILIGQETHRLVKDAIRSEPIEPLTLKGIARPVTAYRVLEVIPGAAGRTRRLDAPLVGRDDEMGLLTSVFRRAVHDESAHLLCLHGAAGVGKSRLALEFARSVEPEALVLEGACVAYGEGSAYRPIAEVVRAAIGVIEDDSPEIARIKFLSFLEDQPHAEEIARGITQLIGIAERSAPARQSFDAVVELVEAIAGSRPLVLWFDDLQWAAPGFLDLVRHIVSRVQAVPLLVLCVARPEILEVDPDWPGTGRATVMALGPLSAQECRRLIAYALGRSEDISEAAQHIVEASAGNPLFLEEILAMLIEDGLLVDRRGRYVLSLDPGTIRLPGTIHALLGARLDRLSYDERAVIEAAAIVGEAFREKEVAELMSPQLRAAVGALLGSLIAKEFVRPETSGFAARPAFRFHHTLIRDVAYEAIPKSTRAMLHERFAVWLGSGARAWSLWLQEVSAHHLEKAYWYRLELGPIDAATEALAARAFEQLSSAGRKAVAARDLTAAADLLRRAVALYPPGRRERLELLPMLADVLADLGDHDEAHLLVSEAIDSARAAGHRGVESHALIVLLKLPRKPGFSVSLGYGLDRPDEVRRTRE